MNKAVMTIAESIGNSISISRRARKMKQAELANLAGIGINTMVSIEKGLTTVQLGLYLEVMNALGITNILSPITNLTGDAEGIASMSSLLPKRVVDKGKPRKSKKQNNYDY